MTLRDARRASSAGRCDGRARPVSRRDGPSPTRSTPTCWTPTTSSPRSSTSAAGSRRASSPPRGCCRWGSATATCRAWFDIASHGPGLLDPRRPARVRDRGSATASPPSWSAPGDLLQAPALPTDDLLERSVHWRVLRPTRLRAARRRSSSTGCGRFRRWRARCCAGPAGAPPSSTCCGRSPPSPGSRSAWCCCSGTWPPAGAGWSPAAVRLCAAAHPPAARPARGRRAPVGLARAQAPGAGGAGQRHGRRPASARHPRAPTRVAARARTPR